MDASSSGAFSPARLGDRGSPLLQVPARAADSVAADTLSTRRRETARCPFMLPRIRLAAATRGGRYMRRIRNHRSGHVRRGGAIATVLLLAAAAVMGRPSAAGAHGPHAAAPRGSGGA